MSGWVPGRPGRGRRAAAGASARGGEGDGRGVTLYLVEMKWHAAKIGTAEISQHLVRVFNRGGARGIFIASEGYTEAAVTTCRESLGQITIALCDLQELVLLLEHGHELERLLRRKVEIAIAERDPYRRILCSATDGP